MKIHLLDDGGLPLCRFTHEAPGFWPPGHMWTLIGEKHPALCAECNRVAKESQTAPEESLAGPEESR